MKSLVRYNFGSCRRVLCNDIHETRLTLRLRYGAPLLLFIQVESLESKLSELEGGIDKHQHEATEHKVS